MFLRLFLDKLLVFMDAEAFLDDFLPDSVAVVVVIAVSLLVEAASDVDDEAEDE